MNQVKPDRVWEPTGFKYNKDGSEYTTWASHPRTAIHQCGCGVYLTSQRVGPRINGHVCDK